MFNTEDKLIKKAQNADREAMSQLYKLYFRGLYIFIRSKVDCNERAEDISSETFIKAFEKISTFTFKSSFKSWLYTIGKNIVYDWYRQKNKEFTIDQIDNDTDNFLFKVNEKEETDENIKYIKSEVNKILEKLQDNYRRVLELRFLFNYSVNETANAMGISINNVKVLQNRALKKAQQILNK